MIDEGFMTEPSLRLINIAKETGKWDVTDWTLSLKSNGHSQLLSYFTI